MHKLHLYIIKLGNNSDPLPRFLPTISLHFDLYSIYPSFSKVTNQADLLNNKHVQYSKITTTVLHVEYQ